MGTDDNSIEANQEFSGEWSNARPAGSIGSSEETVKTDKGFDRVRHEYYPANSGVKGTRVEGLSGTEIRVSQVIARHINPEPPKPKVEVKPQETTQNETPPADNKEQVVTITPPNTLKEAA